MKSSNELKKEALNMLKKGNYWNLFIVGLIISIILMIVNFFSIFLIGTLLVAQSLIYLNVYRKKEFKLETLIEPFQTNYANTLLAYLLKSVYTFLWSLLFIIPGIIKTFSYSMTEFLLADNPNLTPDQAITKSRQLMDGNKMRLFFLYLSFIGWILLSILTFGIGFIFLVPYIKAAETAFYLDLVNENYVVFNDEIEEVEVIIE